jgi:hypothetical protein
MLFQLYERNTKDHNKKAYPRQFHEGEWVLLEVKNFESKNRKLSEIYKGPYIIVKVNKNNTVLLKKRSGNHEYFYNTELLKHYCQPPKKVKEPEKEALTPKTSPLPPAKRKYVKKIYEGRPDGGPTTRSKTKTAGIISPQAKVVHEAIKKTGEEIKSKN